VVASEAKLENRNAKLGLSKGQTDGKGPVLERSRNPEIFGLKDVTPVVLEKEAANRWK